MDVRNCKKCGKLFEYVGQPICSACMKELDEKFSEVRQYIYDNPTSNIATVSEAMDVPVQQIKKWVREERLEFTRESGVALECEKCGASILTGRYCKECKSKMTDRLTGLYQQPAQEPTEKKPKERERMRFLGN